MRHIVTCDGGWLARSITPCVTEFPPVDLPPIMTVAAGGQLVSIHTSRYRTRYMYCITAAVASPCMMSRAV